MTQRNDIAETIRQTIGGPALYMIGAKNLINHGDGLSFRVASRQANYVKITLEAMDTYRVEICKIGRAPICKATTRCDLSGVYFDQLHGLIEKHTGLLTSL